LKGQRERENQWSWKAAYLKLQYEFSVLLDADHIYMCLCLYDIITTFDSDLMELSQIIRQIVTTSGATSLPTIN
jgi:hypothetical protein